MNRSDIDRRDELGEIVRVGRSTVLLPLVLPRADPVISLGIGDEPIPLCDVLSNRLPNAKVRKHSMDENDGFAGALFYIGQANAVDLDFFGQWARHCAELPFPDPRLFVFNLSGGAQQSASTSFALWPRRRGEPRTMSAYGPKQTSASAPHMSAFGSKADIDQPGPLTNRSIYDYTS